MLEKHMFNPNGFQNVKEEGETTGFQFQIRIPYYRGFTLSILRNIEVSVDGEKFPREKTSITVNGETFTQDEARTVIHNRWLFGEFGTVTAQKPHGLSTGEHHISVTVTIAPSYMPMQLVKTGTSDFTI